MKSDMSHIPTLDEAIDACDTLKRFLAGLDATFRSSRVQKPVTPRFESAESAEKIVAHGKNIKIATWPERVRAILREADEPLAAKDIIGMYNERHDAGDPSPEDVGNRIRSVLWQMKGRGQLSHDETNGKYQLKGEAATMR